ncbi:sulfatase [Neorhodopirellula lusitana]|nr:sulfatase [Neorhodopirellula lusitana]
MREPPQQPLRGKKRQQTRSFAPFSTQHSLEAFLQIRKESTPMLPARLKLITIALASLLCLWTVPASALDAAANASTDNPSAEAPRPNVLFIAIDDLRPQLGAYGLDYMVTPNLDQLASQSRLFRKHYVQVPTCGPSRATMLTGKNLHSKEDITHQLLGKWLASDKEPDSPETFIHHFKRNGYHTVGMGKISHNADGVHDGALELRYSWDQFLRCSNQLWRGQELSHAYADGVGRSDPKRPPFERLDLSDEDYPDGQLANLAVEGLKQRAASEEPFFMAIGFFKPHLPFCAPRKYWKMYDRETIPLSPNPDPPADVDQAFLHSSSEFFGQYLSPEKGGVGKRLSDDYAREVIHANFAATSFVDAQVGKVLDQLKQLGLDKNTIIVVWGDHGWHLGDHTIWGKHSMFDRSLRSTLIVQTPDMNSPGVATDGLVASLDIYPTLCDLASLPKTDDIQGESFARLVNDPNANGRDAVLSYWRDAISMKTPHYRLAVHDDGKRRSIMLFDHRVDPNETTNIAVTHPEVVAQLMPTLKRLNDDYLPVFE